MHNVRDAVAVGLLWSKSLVDPGALRLATQDAKYR